MNNLDLFRKLAVNQDIYLFILRIVINFTFPLSPTPLVFLQSPNYPDNLSQQWPKFLHVKIFFKIPLIRKCLMPLVVEELKILKVDSCTQPDCNPGGLCDDDPRNANSVAIILGTTWYILINNNNTK